MWVKCKVKSDRTFVLEFQSTKTSGLCLHERSQVWNACTFMTYYRRNVNWMNEELYGPWLSHTPWTAASACYLEAIGRLLKLPACHLHFFTFWFATFHTLGAYHVCRFHSADTKLSFCPGWVLLLQGVVSAGGVMMQWPAAWFRACTHSSCGVRSTTGTSGNSGYSSSPSKEVWNDCKWLQTCPFQRQQKDPGTAFSVAAFRCSKNTPALQFIRTKCIRLSQDRFLHCRHLFQAVISALLLRLCDFQEKVWLWFLCFDSFRLAGQPR